MREAHQSLFPHTPPERLRLVNDEPPDASGRFVLYWMHAARRTRWNFALDAALDAARALRKPLLVVEPLESGRRWDSDRSHAFALAGMRENAEALQAAGVRAYPCVERVRGDSAALFSRLALSACAVLADDAPMRPLPAETAPVLFAAIDSNGLLPLDAAERVFPTAYAFRRFLQKTLPPHLEHFPEPEPLRAEPAAARATIPADVLRDFPPASLDLLAAGREALSQLPVDHVPAPVEAAPGGAAAGRRLLKRFLDDALARYAEDRNHPDAQASSGLSPYLRFGHVSPHEVFHELAERENWSPALLALKADGRREGWWGMSAPAEAFVDQFVTWREVGANMARRDPACGRFGSLPPWARATLEKHAGDPRDEVYGRAQLEAAETDDPLWNAAQRELLRTGRMHNYLRMLWGKNVLAWSPRPEDALETLLDLNNRWALDGRDPNSLSGVFWVFGRYDRAWGPEREIFGTVRYMTSASARRKLRLKEYLARFG